MELSTNFQDQNQCQFVGDPIYHNTLVQDKPIDFHLRQQIGQSTVSLRSALSKRDKTSLNHEISIQIPLKIGKSISAKITTDYYKLKVALGDTHFDDYLLNVCASVEGKRVIGQEIYTISLGSKADNFQSLWKLGYQKVEASLKLFNKTEKRNGQWVVSTINSLDILNRMWKQSFFQLRWTDSSENSWYLSNSPKVSKKLDYSKYFQDLTLSYIFRYDESHRLGLQVNAGIMSMKLINLTAIWQRKYASIGSIKVQGDINRNFYLTVANSIAGYGSYSYSTSVKDFGKSNQCSCGVHVHFDL